MVVSGIDHVSLCFHQSATEDAFINSRSSHLSFCFSICGSAVFIIVSATLWGNWYDPPLPVGTASQQLVYKHVQLWLGFCAAFSFLCICMPCIPKLIDKIGTRTREVIAVSIVMLAKVFAVPADWVIMSRILGLDHTEVWESIWIHSLFLLLMFVCISGAVHSALPIRWCLLVFEEAATVPLYVAVLIWTNTADARQNWLFYILVLSFMVCCSLLGKRQMERHERIVFLTYIEEKQYRFQLEYQLTHVEGSCKGHKGPRSRDHEEVSSLPSTTLTGQMWCDSNQSLESFLGSVSTLGRAEQWLIESEGLRVNIDHLLGSGGFGCVVSGSFHGTPVAVKLPKNSILDQASRSQIVSLCTEIRIMRRLRHPNLVGFHGALLDVEHGGLALVMELVQGMILKDFVSPDDARIVQCDDQCQILIDLCCALRYLHSRRPRVVHGDLKNTNIMVESLKQGLHAKILDFGLSRLLTRNSKPLGGTMHWMAPEVVRHARPDTTADIFSFGRVAFFTTTGLEPLRNMSKKTIKQLAKHGKVPPLAWPSECTLEHQLKPIVEQCTEHEVTSRPTMTEVHSSISLIAKFPSKMSNNMDDAERRGLRRLQKMFQGHLETFEHNREEAEPSGVALAHVQSPSNLPSLGQLEQVPENALMVQSEPKLHVQPPEKQSVWQCGCVVVPRFKPTPKSSQLGFVLRLLKSLNVEADSSKCCAYHDALEELILFLRKLGKRKCSPAFFDDVVGQCLSCGLMTTAEDNRCLFCDRMSSPSEDDADNRDHLVVSL